MSAERGSDVCVRAAALSAALAMLALASSRGAEPAAKSPSLSSEQRLELTRRLDELPGAQPATDEWFAAAENVLDFGEAGRAELLRRVEGLLRRQKRAYGQAFVVAGRRLRDGGLAEAARKAQKTRLQLEGDMRRDRGIVLGLRSGKTTKQALREQATPAVGRLASLLRPHPAKVLAASADLRERRERLARHLALRDRCGGPKTGRAAIRMWSHSPGHFRNMLGGHRRVGLGRDGRMWTQMFGR